MRSHFHPVLAAAALLFAVGCAKSSSPNPLSCTPGATFTCTCSDGGAGEETCGSSGNGYGACVCGTADAGTDGTPCADGGVSGISCGGACVDVQSDNQNCGACGNACGANSQCQSGTCTWKGTNIQHVVLIVEENHTFDSYFGRYCTAPAYSNPTCTTGRNCCEAAPDADPAGTLPTELTDSANYNSDHDHGASCEVCQIHDGGMDQFTDGGCPNSVSGFASYVTYDCSAPENEMLASDPTLMSTYWNYADQYALADRYFQPIAGGTSSNDMYFAVAHYEFGDNDLLPPARGAGCTTNSSPQPGTALPGRTTIADLLLDHGFTFGVYADGFADAYNADPNCPSAGGDCPEQYLTSACVYDPSDVPFQYYPQFTDDLRYIHDLNQLYDDVTAGTLPDFAYVKYRTSANEHPEWSYISHGEANVDAVVREILQSPTYAGNTLVLLTWDEGGGFFDHVPPPTSIENYPASAGGGPVPYGTRVPLLALGTFAKPGTISHVQMEHSSVVRFLEWNFLGPAGEGAIHSTDLSARDDKVNGIGSLLDPTKVGTAVP